MCTVLLPGCRDKARSDFLGLSRAALSSSLVVSVGVSAFPPANRSDPRLARDRSSVNVIRASGSSQTQPREADRQTDRSNGYGCRWQMLENTGHLPLSSSEQVTSRQRGGFFVKVEPPNARELHSYRGCAVCWPNSLIFFLTADFFNDQTASSFNVIRPDVIPRRLSLCALKNFGEKF